MGEKENHMNKIMMTLVATAEVLAWAGSGPSIAGGGLQLVVEDEKSKGVESEIYAMKDAFELRIGRTDLGGKFTDNNYQCSNDRNLIAKPFDRTYFDSPPQPCRSPQKLLVISRLTPKGNLAFGGFSKSFVTGNGDVGQVAYKATIETVEFNSIAAALSGRRTDPELPKGKPAGISCAFDYKIDVHKSRFVLFADNWEETSNSVEPAKNWILVQKNDIKRYAGIKTLSEDNNILTTENGFILLTKAPCVDARQTAKDLAQYIEHTYVKKIDSGQYDKKELDQFIRAGDK